MGPQQNQLHDDEGAGVHHVLLPQKGPHQRNNQRRRVAVNQGGPLDHVQMQRPFQHRRQGQKQQVQQHRNGKGVQQPGAQRRRIVDLKGLEHHAGQRQIHHYHRKHPAVRRLQQAAAHHGVAHQQNQKQLQNLLCQQQTDFHRLSPSFGFHPCTEKPVGLFRPVFLHRISAHIALVYNHSAAGATAAAGQNPPYSGHLPRLRR